MKMILIPSPAAAALLAAASAFGLALGLYAPSVSTDGVVRTATARAGAIASAQEPAADDEDEEETAYRDALASRAIQENCLICHEANMYTGQRLTPAQWKAEVEKMVSWGAPLPAQDQQSVIDFLAKRYRDVDPSPTPKRIDLAAIDTLEVPRPGADAERGKAVAGADLATGEGLYKVNCANCHGPEGQGAELGPSLVGRAVMNSFAAFDRDVHEGLRRMPGFDKVMDADGRRDVFAWVVGLGRDRGRAEARP